MLDKRASVPWITRLLMLRESVSSVALSHPESCRCDVCRAAHGDEDAMARVLGALADGMSR